MTRLGSAMLYQIVSLLLDVIIGLIGGACLLRLYMQYQRIPMSPQSGNPVGRFIFQLTDWIVLPLRRIVPAVGRVDTASLLAVYLLEVAQWGLLWLLTGGLRNPVALFVIAFFGVLRLAISLAIGLLIVHVVVSWVQAHSPLAELVDRLCDPMLRPVRRHVPPIGGIDLSALVVLLALQVGAIVLTNLQATALQAL